MLTNVLTRTLQLPERDLVTEVRVALKMTLAASLGWWLCTLAGQPRPVFAALVGLVAMSGDPFGAFTTTVARILGVFAGVGIGLAVLQVDARLTLVVALALLLGTLAGITLRVGGRVNIQAAVSALFLVGVGRSGALGAGVARVWETAIGAGVTLLVSVLLWPPDPVRELRARLDRLRADLVADLAAIAEDLAAGSGAVAMRMDDVRAHSLDAVREVFSLGDARRALRLNPLRRRDAAEVDELGRRINLAARLYRHARSIARDVLDAPVRSAALAGAVRSLAGAADLALRGEDARAAIADVETQLAAPANGPALVLREQLRQLLADLARA